MKQLEEAYKKFAEVGYDGILPFIKKSTSQENYIHNLLSYHKKRIKQICALTRIICKSSDEVFQLLEKFPQELKFNKQLFNYREVPEINLFLLYTTNLLKPVLLSIFKNHFHPTSSLESMNSAGVIFEASWYDNLDVNDITADHLKSISNKIFEDIINL